MHKHLGLIFLLLFTSALYAEDFLPCKTNLNSYSLEQGSYFKTCSLSDSKFIFRSVEIGKMGHTCNLKGTAVFDKKQYNYIKDKCAISFTPTERGMTVTYTNDCWYRNCGMQANWKSGEYKKTLP